MVPDDLVPPPLELGRFPPLEGFRVQISLGLLREIRLRVEDRGHGRFPRVGALALPGRRGGVVIDCSLYCSSSWCRRDEGRRGAAGGEQASHAGERFATSY